MKDYILTIQELLKGRNEEFDQTPENRIKLVRHKENTSQLIVLGEPRTESLYELYRHDTKAFLDYQGEQQKGRFDKTDFIVTFLGEEGITSRLIGVYKNMGKDANYTVNANYDYYIFAEVSGFELLKERVIIDWGKSTISWHQSYANIKQVVSIDAGIDTAEGLPIFKSYNDILLNFYDLQKIFTQRPKEWKQALSSVNGIYMIIDKQNGKQYIGKTAQGEGIWHRWEEYAQTGHGGDKDLKQLLDKDPLYARNFQWIILEILNLNVTARESDQRETFYKQKFLTREFGYNNN